jgi:hypothetical protein
VWLLRELLRLLERIAVAVAIALAIAEVRTLASGGSTQHAFSISLLLIGAVMLMMAAAGPGSSYERSLTAVGRYWSSRAGVDDSKTPSPTLTAGAVFVLSGAAVIALGVLLY